MSKQIETIIIFLFLLLFSLGTIYPVLNVLSVSFRTDNAFQTKSLSLIEFGEDYDDLNNNQKWDSNESYIDKNNNRRWDSGSSLKSYKTLFFETDFFLWARNSILISLVVTMTGVTFAGFLEIAEAGAGGSSSDRRRTTELPSSLPCAPAAAAAAGAINGRYLIVERSYHSLSPSS